MVLVRSSFTGSVRMGEIEFRPLLSVDTASLDSLDVHEFSSAVASHSDEDAAKCLAS